MHRKRPFDTTTTPMRRCEGHPAFEHDKPKEPSMNRIARSFTRSAVCSVVFASLAMGVSSVAPAAASAGSLETTVVEFYNARLDHYFVTHDDAEISNLDNAIPSGGWERTGET